MRYGTRKPVTAESGNIVAASVADPDPDPVGSGLFGSHGSGSGKIPDPDPDPLSTKRPL